MLLLLSSSTARTRVRASVSALLVGAALLVPAGGAFAYSPDNQELAFLDLINAYRSENGLGTLVLQDELGDAAENHSADMGANDYFAHTLADGTDAGQNIRNFGYTGPTWGENIAAGMASASEAMVAWQNSPGHNAAMLDPDFAEIGIGREYVEGSSYGWYWTTTFGGGEGENGGGNRAPEPVPAQVLDTGDAAAAAGDGTVNGAPVEGGNAPATVNGVPVESGTIVTTVNGVPVDTAGNIVNADGEVITTILDPAGAPVDAATTTVADEASIATGDEAQQQQIPAEGTIASYEEVPAEAPIEAAPAEAAPAEAAPAEGTYQLAQDAPADAAPADDGAAELAQEAPAADVPVDDGGRRQSDELAQDVYEPPTINGVPVESGTYDVDGGVVRDADGDAQNSANADGPNIVEGDIEGGGTFVADGGASEDATAAEPAPAPASTESESAPAPESTTTTTPGTNGTGTVTTTTVVNGVQMEDGTSTEYGNAQGDGASAAPGNVTYGG